MHKNLADLRRVYALDGLTEESSGACPFQLFEHWLEAALVTETLDPNAMTLATVDAQGRPKARIVLLKGFSAAPNSKQGWVFYTNYTSAKGQELAQNPCCSLLFWWEKLQRQVRIEGRVEKISAADSDAYYHSRPKSSQIGAWVSEQSQVIADRSILQERELNLTAQYADLDLIPRPPHWGGYLVVPSQVEFWQGRPSRLHDRLRFRREDLSQPWLKERLAP